MSNISKVVLAYSGGLDTSVIVRWLQDTYGAEVVTFTADIDGSNVRLLAQCASADSTVFKFQGIIINV